VIARVVIVVALAFVVAGAAPASGATALMPDLGMAKLSTVTLDTTTMPGHRLLRYTAVMVNIGAGRLEVRGTRPDTSSQMTVKQRIYNTGGGHTDRATSIAMQYAGDGHEHWHSLDMEGGTLAHVDSGGTVSALAKHGFCFFDNVKYRLTLPGAPATAHYVPGNSCAFGNPDALNVMMGLSVGWGDQYSASTNFQWIDITALPNGRYRLTATADPGHLVRESSYANNAAWATIRISGTSVTVLRYGPGA
jgi:hypothetical protein